jgi:hypothetical protein
MVQGSCRPAVVALSAPGQTETSPRRESSSGSFYGAGLRRGIWYRSRLQLVFVVDRLVREVFVDVAAFIGAVGVRVFA